MIHINPHLLGTLPVLLVVKAAFSYDFVVVPPAASMDDVLFGDGLFGLVTVLKCSKLSRSVLFFLLLVK